MKGMSHQTGVLLAQVARRVVFMFEQGEIKPEPGAERKARDLQNRARQAIEQAVRRREVRS